MLPDENLHKQLNDKCSSTHINYFTYPKAHKSF